jgi:beta-phosphoglucomutase-like phosphatase (HAD superfamily)
MPGSGPVGKSPAFILRHIRIMVFSIGKWMGSGYDRLCGSIHSRRLEPQEARIREILDQTEARMNGIKAVLWDNDGILVDSEIIFYEVTRSAFARLGLELTKDIWGIQCLGEGRSSRTIAASMGADPVDFNPVLDDRNARYREVLRIKPPAVRARVPETLALLSGRVKLGIVTGCHRDQFHLMHRSSGLPELFDVIITGDNCAEPKPHPGLYLAALEAMNLKAEECIAIEDTRRGLLSATAAGIDCVVVRTELTRMQDFAGALAVEDDIPSILKYVGIDELNNPG